MATLALFLCLAAIVPAIPSQQYLMGWQVQSPSGPIQGYIDNATGTPVQVYLGIRYAEPPVRSLRFLKPIPVYKWQATYLATERAPACVQPQSDYPWSKGIVEQSEDCLHLNVWAPVDAREGQKKAVMFYIFGGDFTVGWNNAAGGVYDGDVLAGNHDVIVVVVNYRLGVFGFATSGTDDAPGNVGLYDIFTALKWVHRNIPSFGGDPNRITIFGQGSGSVAASLLCVSPMAKGYFSNAILMSGAMASLTGDRASKNKELTQRFADQVGCTGEDANIDSDPEDVMDCLRAVPPRQLASAVPVDSFNLRRPDSFSPQFGDQLLPDSVLLDGNTNDVNLLIGNVYGEGSLRLATAFPDVFDQYAPEDPTINKELGAEMLRRILKGFPSTEAVIKYYLDPLNNTDYDLILREVGFAVGDYNTFCPSVYFAEKFGDHPLNSVYYYLHIHRVVATPDYAPWLGIQFFSEVPLVFGRPFQLNEYDQYSVWDRNVSAALMKIWTHFAMHGEPPVAFEWPKYSSSMHNYIFPWHTVRYLLVDGPHLQNCDFFRQYFKCALLENLPEEERQDSEDGGCEVIDLPDSSPEAVAAVANRTDIGTPIYMKRADTIRSPYTERRDDLRY